MIPHLSALRYFLGWVESGGETKAGLPAGSLAALRFAATPFESRLVALDEGVEKLDASWRKISTTDNTRVTLMRMRIQQLIDDLSELVALNKELTSEAANVRVLVQDAFKIVKYHIQYNDQQVAEGIRQLNDAQQRREQAIRELNEAKAELQGDKGFLNSFLTGLTFTAYNPIQENIDKAKAAASRINDSYATSERLVATLNLYKSELDQAHTLLRTLDTLDSVFTDYQNRLNTAQMAMDEAHDHEARVAGATSEGLATHYRQIAGHDMDSLLSFWQQYSDMVHSH